MKALLCLLLVVGTVQAAHITHQEIVTATTAGVEVMPGSGDRIFLHVENRGGGSVLMKFNSTFSATEGILIGGNSSKTFKAAPKGSVYLKGVTADTPVFIMGGVE